MIIYAVTIAALPRAPGRPVRLSPSYWVTATVGVLICAAVAAQADRTAWLTLVALSMVGLLLYLFTRRGSPAA
jgi:lysylphosphatidylglycerol synthetase-like protein (DUF2156 family)